MKIQLVTDSTPTVQARPRVPFSACPLCEGQSAIPIRDVDGSAAGPLIPELEANWSWVGCETCGHLFTSGHLDEPTNEALHARPGIPTQVEPDLAVQRQQAAQIVHRISELRGTLEGLWLDAGCGKGALLTTAHEFGYETLGLDPRQANVTRLRELNYLAECASIVAIDGEDLFDVISFNGSLEQQAFPAQALKAAQRLLRPGGALFVSAPNVDSFAWRQLDADECNPYWSDPERFHHFSREHLYWLLRRSGFEPCDYSVSPRTAAGMEVCAALASNVS